MEKFSYRHILLNVAPWVITAAALVLLALRPDASAQRPAATNPGRYQLFTATHNGRENGQTTETKSLFKIDTETGATWFYMQYKDSKTELEGWVPANNLSRRQ